MKHLMGGERVEPGTFLFKRNSSAIYKTHWPPPGEFVMAIAQRSNAKPKH